MRLVGGGVSLHSQAHNMQPYFFDHASFVLLVYAQVSDFLLIHVRWGIPSSPPEKLLLKLIHILQAMIAVLENWE